MTINVDAHAWHESNPLHARARSNDGQTCSLRIAIGTSGEQAITLFLKAEHFKTVEHIAELLNQCTPVPAKTPR